MQQISDYELELMKAIWGNGDSALYAEIVASLSARDMHLMKNTIITLLSRLIDKGLLKTNKIGHRNRYTAIVSADEYQSSQTEHFLDKVYEGNAKGLVSTLIQKDLLSASDYEDLKKHWQAILEKAESGTPQG